MRICVRTTHGSPSLPKLAHSELREEAKAGPGQREAHATQAEEAQPQASSGRPWARRREGRDMGTLPSPLSIC